MNTYYNPEDLGKFGTIGEKSLIALAVAHTVQCPYCMTPTPTTV